MPIGEDYWAALEKAGTNLGEEFDWFAVDLSGFLAVFSNAGRGPVPASVWANRVPYNALVEACAKLPTAFAIEKVFEGSGTYSDWWNYAARGLYAFDFQDVHRTKPLRAYDLMARPQLPIRANELLSGANLSWLPLLEIEFVAVSAVPSSAIG